MLMPMALVRFRFDGRVPGEGEVMPALRTELGRRARHIDSIEVREEHVDVLSMDPVALVYAMKVLIGLGGVRVDPGNGQDRAVALPAWTERRWPDHSWTEKLAIRLGRISTACQPSGQPSQL